MHISKTPRKIKSQSNTAEHAHKDTHTYTHTHTHTTEVTVHPATRRNSTQTDSCRKRSPHYSNNISDTSKCLCHPRYTELLERRDCVFFNSVNPSACHNAWNVVSLIMKEIKFIHQERVKECTQDTPTSSFRVSSKHPSPILPRPIPLSRTQAPTEAPLASPHHLL